MQLLTDLQGDEARCKPCRACEVCLEYYRMRRVAIGTFTQFVQVQLCGGAVLETLDLETTHVLLEPDLKDFSPEQLLHLKSLVGTKQDLARCILRQCIQKDGIAFVSER